LEKSDPILALPLCSASARIAAAMSPFIFASAWLCAAGERVEALTLHGLASDSASRADFSARGLAHAKEIKLGRGSAKMSGCG
jgi:hypothetical protein